MCLTIASLIQNWIIINWILVEMSAQLDKVMKSYEGMGRFTEKLKNDEIYASLDQ